jgi:hypothetical protein
MSAAPLIDCLDGVKRTGPGRWIAKCPAHDDRQPSLAVRELDDGRVLLHCFAQCAVEDVLAAVGLTFDTLFPERPIDERRKPERRSFPAADVLRALTTEIAIVVIYVADHRAGHIASHQDHERFLLACSRIGQADYHAKQ